TGNFLRFPVPAILYGRPYWQAFSPRVLKGSIVAILLSGTGGENVMANVAQ
ncbi:MAG: hypothetical protein ACI974_002185, partial [Paraglaciecola sp.]